MLVGDYKVAYQETKVNKRLIYVHVVIPFTSIHFHFFLIFAVLLPFGEYIINNLPDPFDCEKILSLSADIIAQRTGAKSEKSGSVSKGVRSCHLFEKVA